MALVAKSDQSTGNSRYASYVLQSNELVFTFTAPYSRQMADPGASVPSPNYSQETAYSFLNTHGMAVRAVGKRGCNCNCCVSHHGCSCKLDPVLVALGPVTGSEFGGVSMSQRQD